MEHVERVTFMNEDFDKILKEAVKIHRVHNSMLKGIEDPVERHHVYCERLHGFCLGLYAANDILNTSPEEYGEGGKAIAELIHKLREKDFYGEENVE